ETVKTKVINLYVFDSFETLYQKLPLEKCGYTSENISSARAEDMEYYYTKPQQKKCGVIGIEISLLGE
ncbi:MAG: RNA-binding protein, partial [Clostridia bacterium]|nr:RNA-binding protein [Clostridia bacterium]